MDATLQKTVNVLAQLAPNLPTPGSGSSNKSFQYLVRAIGEAKTKHEEDRIMKREAILLKERLSARDTNTRQMREYLIRLIYCEMLGVECTWGYIHAVKFTQNNNIVDKRIGYLTSSLLLHPDHELNMLLINSIQRDLRSSNMLEVSMALIIICRLIGEEMVPPLLPLVREKMHHPKELVRKKAILAMHHFYKVSPGSISHLMEDFRRALSDPDPGVMEASLILLYDVIKDSPSKHKDLCGAFKSILSQVINRHLPSQFEYHSVPAPWIQMRLLRILALLGADDAKKSEEMYDVIEKTLASAECNSNIGQAITYECIKTITTIYLRPSLIQQAANAIARFLLAANNNWKYLGINALASLVLIEPKYALDHQMTVIECLDDPDETLKRKTLDLLYKMTNPANVTVITERLITYLRNTTDDFIKTDLVNKITQLAEKFAPDNQWFITTMNSVFELGGSLVRKEVAHNLMRLIAEGTEDDEMDKELRRNAVNSYIQLLDQPHLPDVLIKIICWVVGEYAYEVEDEHQMEDVLDKMTSLLNLEFKDVRTYSWIINSITRLIALIGYVPEYLHSQLAVYLAWEDTDVQQRCSELFEFSERLELMQSVLPLDSSCEDIEIDSSLSFLDTFVSESLVKGAPPYKPLHMRNDKPSNSPKIQHQPVIKFEPYAAPVRPTPSSVVISSSSPSLTRKDHTPLVSSSSQDLSDESVTIATSTGSGVQTPDIFPGIQSKGEKRWTKGGYSKSATVATCNSEIVPQSDHRQTPDILDSRSDGGSSVEERDEPTTVTSTKVNNLEAVPQLTAEQTKKKQLASALFTGLTTTTSDPPQRVTAAKYQKRTTSHVKESRKASHEDNLLNLDDIDFSQPTSNSPIDNNVPPTNAPPTNAPPTQQSSSLFDDVMLIDTPAKERDTSSQATYSDDLIGLFDDVTSSGPPLTSSSGPLIPTSDPLMSSSGPSISSSSPLMSSSGPLIPTSDPLASYSSSSLDHSEPLSDDLLLPTTALAIMDRPSNITAINVPSELSHLNSVSGWNKKELTRDVQLRLSTSKLLHSDQLIILFIISNQKQTPATSITMTCEPPSNIQASIWGEQSESSGTLSWTGELEGFANGLHIVSCTPKGPAVTMNMRGEIHYIDSTKTQRRLFYDFSLHPSDFIRPFPITTPEFAQKWGAFSNEKRLSLMPLSSIKNLSDFMNVISKQFNFSKVEIIGNEGISSSKFLPNTHCLIHSKVTSSSLEVWIRSPSGLCTDSLAKEIQLFLK